MIHSELCSVCGGPLQLGVELVIIKFSSNVIFTIIIIKKTQYVYRTSVSIFYRRKMLTCNLTFWEDQYVFRKIGFDFTLEIDQF